MENRKWLKRKYPDTFNEVNEFMDDNILMEFKRYKYKLGRLKNDIHYVQKYPKDSLVIFKRRNPVTDESYPLIYTVIKCQNGFTESGYHSIETTENDIVEINK